MIDRIEVLNTEPEQFLPDDLNYTDSNTKKESGQCLKKFYFGEKQVSKDNLNEYIRVIILSNRKMFLFLRKYSFTFYRC